MMENKAPLTEREILAILDAYAESAISTRSSKLSKERAKAMDYYNMQLYGDETKTGSKVVTSEVFDTVETLATRMVKVFTSTDKAVEFVPEGPEDIEAADQKTKYCNHIFYRENNGFLVLYEAIKGGLLMKNGIIKVYPEVNKSVQFGQYEGLTEMQAAVLAEDPDTQFISAAYRQDTDGTVLLDIGVKRVNKDVKIKVEAVAPEKISVCGWHGSVLLEEADYVRHRDRLTVTKLREMGLVGPDEDVDSLGSAGLDQDDMSEEEQARDAEVEEQRLFRENNPLQTEMWRVVVDDIIARVDEDGDGIAERRRIIRIGDTIRFDEPTDYCGYGVFAPILMPHRFIGKAPADLVMQQQHIQSTLLRQTLTNIYLNNHQRPIVLQQGNTPQADMDSLMTAGPGQPIFEKQAGAIRYEAPPPMAADIIGVSEHVRQLAEPRTGVTRLSQGINPDLITKNAAGGLATVLTENASEREEMYCRVFAETCLKQVFASIAHLASKYQNRKKMIRIYNKFVEMDPSNWSEGLDMTINVGLGSGTARQTTANIADLMSKQEMIVQGGGLGTLVTPQNLFNAASKYAETIGFKDPSVFFNDPSTVEPKPPEPSIEEKQLAALERIEQLKALVKKLEIESHAKEAEEKNAVELQKAALEGRIKMEMKRMDLGLESSKIDAEVILSAQKNRTDTDIAVMHAVSNLDQQERRDKTALELEDKKVVSIRSKDKSRQQPKDRNTKVKMIETDSGGSYEPEGDAARKVVISELPGGFEAEIKRKRSGDAVSGG